MDQILFQKKLSQTVFGKQENVPAAKIEYSS